MKPLLAHHYNGTATTTPAKIQFDRMMQKIHIVNNDGTNSLQISFDKGRTFFTILLLDKFSEAILCHEIWVKSSASTVVYSLLALG